MVDVVQKYLYFMFYEIDKKVHENGIYYSPISALHFRKLYSKTGPAFVVLKFFVL